jgi:AcrR family transcriptional regulator
MARKYAMRRRAEQVEATRLRITEAAVELHGTVGPARTTISAVAEHAGVERLTVYRHFPDEHALFQACSGHWLKLNPPPDPSAWTAADPAARLTAALEELYGWYRRTEPMMANFFRDGPLVPALAGRLQEWGAFVDAGKRALSRGWSVRGKRRALLLAAIGHALDFGAWASLARQGLDDREAARLMARLAAAASEGEPASAAAAPVEAAP